MARVRVRQIKCCPAGTIVNNNLNEILTHPNRVINRCQEDGSPPLVCICRDVGCADYCVHVCACVCVCVCVCV